MSQQDQNDGNAIELCAPSGSQKTYHKGVCWVSQPFQSTNYDCGYFSLRQGIRTTAFNKHFI